jgi:uncharacterized FAD-dependent dehydrogenase
MNANFFEVCIVGLGPAGIGAACRLSKSNMAKSVLCIESGECAKERHCQILNGRCCEFESPCQMISGVGGCSLLASGKVSGYPAGGGLVSILGSPELAKMKLSKSLELLKELVPLQDTIVSPDQIAAERSFRDLGFGYRFYPICNVRQDQLLEACETFFSDAKAAGMSMLLNTEVTKIEVENQHFKLTARCHKKRVTIHARKIVVAVGRLGQKLMKSISRISGSCSEVYHLDVGVRLEFPTEVFPEIDRYHKDLKLVFDGARTFCVCKNGMVAPYKYGDIFLLEGYYNPESKSGLTNLSIMARSDPSKQNIRTFNAIRRMVKKVGDGKPVRQILSSYLENKRNYAQNPRNCPSSNSFWVWGDVNQCFPPTVAKRVNLAVEYFATRLLPKSIWEETSVFAPEADCRLIPPINTGFCLMPGLYLAGDCAGRFRGILQAFCSGVECADGIIGDSNADARH